VQHLPSGPQSSGRTHAARRAELGSSPADNADDLVNRDIVVTLLEKKRRRRTDNAFAALLDGFRAAAGRRFRAWPSCVPIWANQGLGFLDRHVILTNSSDEGF